MTGGSLLAARYGNHGGSASVYSWGQLNMLVTLCPHQMYPAGRVRNWEKMAQNTQNCPFWAFRLSVARAMCILNAM